MVVKLQSAKTAPVTFQVKAFACFGRVASFCQKQPWPLSAMKADPRSATMAAALCGAADSGKKAAVDENGPRGGGRRIILVKRPQGDIKDSDFEFVTEHKPEPQPGEALVQAIYISIDPTHRIWMSDEAQYMPCVGLGTCMRAGVIGKVIKSTTGKLKPGTYVNGLGGVQEYFCCPEAALNPVIPGVPLSLNHSLFSLVIGGTAWVGVNICEPHPGQTMVVSGAAGAVGSVAAQLAKARGMKVVGIAGSEKKVKWLLEELKLDGAINYKAEDVAKGIDRCCPAGVDAYFDNVGGATLEAVLTKMNRFGRIAYCGHISGYNTGECDAVQVNQYQMILHRRIKVQGFICMDHLPDLMKCMTDLLNLYIAGKLQVQEHIEETSVDNYPSVVRMLYTGANEGKLMMQVAPE